VSHTFMAEPPAVKALALLLLWRAARDFRYYTA
jgi:hypothetical protein